MSTSFLVRVVLVADSFDYRFAGSERGIFEFNLNVQDRMQSPIIEMR